jgi:hypothetical protein
MTERPAPGSADLCFVASVPPAPAMQHVCAQCVDILEGPVERTGATGTICLFISAIRMVI